jgi:hypothetical protein|nr:hypothetical protein [Neorhizobium tomejilense]
MTKDKFLRDQYAAMIASDEFVASEWRDSIDRFVADMWERTPTYPRGRVLIPVDPELGFSRDNVEYRFPAVRKKRSGRATSPKNSVKRSHATPKPQPLSAAEKKALLLKERDARRQKLAAEFLEWERRRSG